jgi:hypothetical protein
LIFIVPSSIQIFSEMHVRAAENMILSGDPVQFERGISALRSWRWFADVDRLVLAYEKETDPTRKQGMANAYTRITGEDAEARLTTLRD